MLKNKKIILIVLLVIAVAVVWIKASANDDNNTISVSASSSSVTAGEEVNITVGISTSGSSVGMAVCNLVYDSNNFDYVSGGNLNSGYVALNFNGTSSATVTFRAKDSGDGVGSFYIDQDSIQVATQDGTLYGDSFDSIGSCNVEVTSGGSQGDTAPIISPSEINLKVGQGAQISFDNEVEIDPIGWQYNEAIVEVSSSGYVTAVGAGETQIKARSSVDGVESNAITVIVTENSEPGTIAINPSSLTIVAGTSGQLYGPDGVEIASWASSNSAVASVTQTGYVTGIAASDEIVTITATATDGSQGTASVKVNSTIPPEDPVAEDNMPRINNGYLNLKVNDISGFSITNEIPVIWSSSNPSVASIDGSSGAVVALSAGITTIRATSIEHPEYVATATVYVTKPYEEGAPVISVDGLVNMTIGEQKQVTSDTSGVQWSSSDTAVVQVDQTGKLTAISAGSAKITVLNPSANKSSEFFVSVTDGSTNNEGNNEGTNNGSSKTNTVSPTGSENSTSENDVPATGESTVEMLILIGIVTCIIATVIFRKKAK